MGSFAEGSTAAVQHSGEGELGTSLSGWHDDSSPSACGGSQGENPEGEALGRSQGGFSTKVHLQAEGGGKLITLVLTPGQRHEAPVFPQLMAQGAVKGAKGRPRLRPHRVVGDKGYSSRAIRRYARQHGIRITIPRKVNECRKGPFDREVYKQCNLVERLSKRLKQFRRLATRYEKRAANYRAMWIIAATLYGCSSLQTCPSND
jgi:transposase